MIGITPPQGRNHLILYKLLIKRISRLRPIIVKAIRDLKVTISLSLSLTAEKVINPEEGRAAAIKAITAISPSRRILIRIIRANF